MLQLCAEVVLARARAVSTRALIHTVNYTIAKDMTSRVAVSVAICYFALFLHESNVLRDLVYEPLLHKLRAFYELYSTALQPLLPLG